MVEAGISGLMTLISFAMDASVAIYMAALTGDWAYLAEMALRAVLAVCGIPYDAFIGTMGKVVESWDLIVANPGLLVENGIDAVAQGFTQFGENFIGHFIGGAVEWITGTNDLVMPGTFDIAGIFDVACQVLGVTTDYLWDKAEEHLGPEATAAMQVVVDGVMAMMDGGWEGLWDGSGQLITLVDDVVIAIGMWLVEKAIFAAGRWVAGLIMTLGASAIVEGIVAIWPARGLR